MGWLESGISTSRTEDVAQHSFETTAITLIIVDFLEREINSEKALRMAIVHDWAEAVTGDFSKDVSTQLSYEVKEDIEERVMKSVLMEGVPNKKKYLDLWKEYNKKETLEAKIVRFSDLMSILLEAKSLFDEGESSEKLEDIWDSTLKEAKSFTEEFPFLSDLIQSLSEDYPPQK